MLQKGQNLKFLGVSLVVQIQPFLQVLQPSKAKRFFFLGHPVVENITISRYWIWNEFEDFDLVSAKSSHNWQFSFKKIFAESTYKLLPDDNILLMLYYIFYLFLLSIGQH